MFDINELMRKAKEMSGQMQQIQEDLARKEITAEAGGGMVQATVNGRLELTKLRIDRNKVDPNDLELLEDVIVAAVHGAQQRAGQILKDEMAKRAGEMGLPPGMLGM